MNESPDFCKPNYNLASYGTKGRICNKSSRGIDSCKLLCCGRQFKTKLETIKYNCSCTFTWCCSVTCKECTKTQYVSTCKWYLDIIFMFSLNKINVLYNANFIYPIVNCIHFILNSLLIFDTKIKICKTCVKYTKNTKIFKIYVIITFEKILCNKFWFGLVISYQILIENNLKILIHNLI